MARDAQCPICTSGTRHILDLRFNEKLNLPRRVTIRFCERDNFLFVANGAQEDYDEYYGSSANDSYHAELSEARLRSPIAQVQRDHLAQLLGPFFDRPRRVLDFGCGEACLLVELASDYSSSTFVGYDPGPGSAIGSRKADILGLNNLSVVSQFEVDGPYDLLIASHVVEHLLSFELLRSLSPALSDEGILYLEVPDALRYGARVRDEFLYYFDRLHVNHFTPQSLARLASLAGFACMSFFEYDFPYRDGGLYPALGMLLRKGTAENLIRSSSLLDSTNAYLSKERERAAAKARELSGFEGVLIWGAGDNFFRSMSNGGPLSSLSNVVLLDVRPQEIVIGNRTYLTVNPLQGINDYRWPVVITISEGRRQLRDQVRQVDPLRPVFDL